MYCDLRLIFIPLYLNAFLLFKDTGDFLLLSYDVKLIKDDEFSHLLRFLTRTACSPKLDLPYDSCVFEEELEELKSRNEKLVVSELGFGCKEESLKRLKPQHEYCFLHKSFEESGYFTTL